MLLAYDIQGSVGSRLFPSRRNILAIVRTRRLTEHQIVLQVDQIAPKGDGIELISPDIMESPKDTYLHSQTLNGTVEGKLPPVGQLCWFRNTVELDLDTNYIFDESSQWLPSTFVD